MTVPPCPYLHGRTSFGPSCTVFVYPGCLQFDNGATSKFDDVLLEHGGLPYVLPLAVYLHFLAGQVEVTILKLFYPLSYVVGTLLHA